MQPKLNVFSSDFPDFKSFKPENKTTEIVQNLLDTDCKEINAYFEFCNCFVYKDEFEESKQFRRYVDKVKAQLCTFADNAIVSLRDKSVISLAGAVAYFIEAKYLSFIYDEEYNVTDAVINEVVDPMYTFSKEFYLFLTDHIYDVDSPCFDGKYSFGDIIELHLKNLCKKHIALNCAKHNNLVKTEIDETTFIVKTLPLTIEQSLQMLMDLVGLISDDLCHLYVKERNEQRIKEEIKSRHTKQTEELKKYKEDREAFEADIDELVTENKLLEEALESQTQKSEAAYRDLLESNRELAKKEAKARRNYNSLLEKYQRLLDAVGEPEAEETPYTETEVKKLDVNKRYVFIADNTKSTFCSNITKAFPNSTITIDPIKLSADTTDMVIAITEMVNHSSYIPLKVQCKNKGIPFIHCPYKNIDMIKQVMEAQINQ